MRAGPQASRRLAPSPNALKKVLRGDEEAHTQCRMIVDQRMMIDRLRGDASAQRWRNSPRERRVLVEREMCARVQRGEERQHGWTLSKNAP